MDNTHQTDSEKLTDFIAVCSQQMAEIKLVIQGGVLKSKKDHARGIAADLAKKYSHATLEAATNWLEICQAGAKVLAEKNISSEEVYDSLFGESAALRAIFTPAGKVDGDDFREAVMDMRRNTLAIQIVADVEELERGVAEFTARQDAAPV